MWKIKLIVFAALFATVSIFLHWSSKRIDYSRLENFLSKEDWENADRETISIIGKVMMNSIDEKYFFGYSRLDIFGLDSIRVMMNDLPCHRLQEIDELWSSYSSGKFGFTAQTKILNQLKITINSKDQKRTVIYSDSEKFGRHLKWDSRDFLLGSMKWEKSLDFYPDGFLPSNKWARYNARKPIGTGTVILVLDKFRQCKPTSP